MNREAEGNRSAADVKIGRNRFEEDAEGKDRNSWLAEEKTASSKSDNPPAIEKPRIRLIEWYSH
jgi:hypothetical protein